MSNLSNLATLGLAMLGTYAMFRFGRPEGDTLSNATYATLRRRIKYGGRKGRRAMIRMYGSRKEMREAPTLGDVLAGKKGYANE